MMFQRILAVVAVTFLLAACETASQVSGDSVNKCRALLRLQPQHHLNQQKNRQPKSLHRLVIQ